MTNHDPNVKGRAARPAGSRFWISTPELMAMDIPPLRWIIADFLPEGLSILVGRQKLGKSQLALNIAVAIETGGTFLGHRVGAPGAVLYLDLELGQRRVRKRLDEMGQLPELHGLGWVMPDAGVPRLGPEFFGMLDEWRAASTNPSAVIIDIVANVMPAPGKGNAYQEENKALAPLRDYANRHGIAVVMIHHTKQGDREDPLERASGSNAMTSVPNQAYILDGKEGDKILTLYARGHDIEERKIAVSRDAAGWFTNLGDATIVTLKASRRKIAATIAAHGAPMTLGDIANETDIKYATVRQTCRRMVTDGQLMQVGKAYQLMGGKRHNLSDAVDNPLPNKDILAPENVTVPVSQNQEDSHTVPNTVTLKKQPSVTELSPYIAEDISSSVTKTEFSVPSMNSVLSQEEQGIYFLRYLIGNRGGAGEHRLIAQRCSNVSKEGKQFGLSGDDIRRLVPGLVDRGIITVTAHDRKGDAKGYKLTNFGIEEYHRMIADPAQASIFDQLT